MDFCDSWTRAMSIASGMKVPKVAPVATDDKGAFDLPRLVEDLPSGKLASTTVAVGGEP